MEYFSLKAPITCGLPFYNSETADRNIVSNSNSNQTISSNFAQVYSNIEQLNNLTDWRFYTASENGYDLGVYFIII